MCSRNPHSTQVDLINLSTCDRDKRGSRNQPIINLIKTYPKQRDRIQKKTLWFQYFSNIGSRFLVSMAQTGG